MALVEHGAHAGQLFHLAETGDEVFPVGVVRVGAEVAFMPIARQTQTLPGTGQPGPGGKAVVLDEAHKHAGEQPVHGGLGNDRLHPSREGLATAAGLPRRLPFSLQAGAEVGVFADADAQVVFQGFQETLQVFQECA